MPRKLGIREGHRVALVGAPADFEATLGEMPSGVTPVRTLRGSGRFDVIVFFTTRSADLAARVPRLKARLEESGGLWIAWPKKASGVPTEIGEADVRTAGLSAGLVDNKICAVDDTWSGLRFVVRLRDRTGGGGPGDPRRRP